MDDGGNDLRLRQLAMQIAIQLPTNQVEAVQVLKYVEDLRLFLIGKGLPEPPSRPPLRII
jgi:hypothetical protein